MKIPKAKLGFTYFLPNHASALEYLSKHCADIKTSKVDILNEALIRLFKRVKPYKDILQSSEYKKFETQYKKELLSDKK